jgi:type II secretory pathway pseudopilin PulG
MAALLVALGIMAVMMTVAMPVWKQAAQREKEEELVFRGQQYVHAITLFSRKYANNFPPNIDVLVRERFLRKKFKDPITNDDFQTVAAGQGTPGLSAPGQPGQRQSDTGGRQSSPSPGATGAGGRESASGSPARREPSPSVAGGRESSPGSPAGRQSSPVPTPTPTGRGSAPVGGRGTPTTGGGGGGIIGVVSKSKDKSIRLYNGRGRYNEWAFVYTAQNQTPGAGGAPGAAAPGQRGQPGQRGGPGTFGPGGGQPTPGRRGGTGGRNPFQGGVSPFEPQPPPTRGRSGR